MLTQVKIYIKGDVIGVGFRAWTKIQAKFSHVHGWVRNEYDRPEIFGPSGGVEAMLQGEEESIEKILDIIRKGPPIAQVDDVEVMIQEPTEVYETFEIRK